MCYTVVFVQGLNSFILEQLSYSIGQAKRNLQVVEKLVENFTKHTTVCHLKAMRIYTACQANVKKVQTNIP